MANKRNMYGYAESIIHLVRALHERRLTMRDMGNVLGVSGRTAYRQLEILERLGFPIEKDFDGKFFIASDECPFCKKPTTTTNECAERIRVW